MDVAVIVSTCGDRSWIDLAAGRALPSVASQTAAASEIIVRHSPTSPLHHVRNEAAEQATAEWLCFLDADDELHPDYLAAMATASGDLRAPALQPVKDGEDTELVVLSGRNIDSLNPCVIGTLVRREMFAAVGGFWYWPAWEDWCLWRRCWLAGAVIEHVPTAIYRAHVHGTRNSSSAGDNRLHRRITDRHRRWQKGRAAA